MTVIKGTPSASGVGLVTITVTDKDGSTDSGSYWLYVKPAIQYLELTPEFEVVAPGEGQAYSAEAFSRTGEDLGPVSFGYGAGQAQLSITDGTCDILTVSCSATDPGFHTVTAIDGGAEGTATLYVEEEGEDCDEDGDPGDPEESEECV
jgi:hypothetical protein